MLLEYKVDSEYETLLMRGVVLSGMFQLSGLNKSTGWGEYPVFMDGNWEFPLRGAYGVCDSLENLLEEYPELLDESDGCRKFVVVMHRIDKSDQPDLGGWRWHKWGDYIGKQTPTCEYIYDEPIIETVYCFHIYEKL